MRKSRCTIGAPAPAFTSTNLNLLRSIAVLAVYINHLWYSLGWRDFTYFHFGALGRMGVLMFFVHTSLVLTMSLDRSHEPAGSFYLRRAFRIYPLSMICVLYCVATHMPVTPWLVRVPLSFVTILSNLVLTQNITNSPNICGPLWSLPYEVQMYLVLPFIYSLYVRRAARDGIRLIIGTVAAYLMFRICHLQRAADLMQFFPCFLAGLLAFLFRGKPVFPGAFWSLVVITLLLVGVVLLSLNIPAKLTINWMICILIGRLIPTFSEVHSAWLHTIGHALAKYSYGIYLCHIPAMWIGLHISNQVAIQIGVILVLSACLPVLAYHIVEEPMISLGKCLSKAIYGRHSHSRTCRVASSEGETFTITSPCPFMPDWDVKRTR